MDPKIKTNEELISIANEIISSDGKNVTVDFVRALSDEIERRTVNEKRSRIIGKSRPCDVFFRCIESLGGSNRADPA